VSFGKWLWEKRRGNQQKSVELSDPGDQILEEEDRKRIKVTAKLWTWATEQF
jgi:hypothetical protein